jgi:hypothetical protein
MISLTITQNVVNIEESIILASANLGLELYNIVVATHIVGLDGQTCGTLLTFHHMHMETMYGFVMW